MRNHRCLAALLAAALLLAPGAANAAQSSCAMPLVGPLKMAEVMVLLNSCITALMSNNSGTTAPANSPASSILQYQVWIDTSTSPPSLKIFDGTQSVVAGTINTSTHAWTPALTGDQVVGRATTDTLTHKTYDTAGTGNSFSINGLAATANTGTGSVVRATSPTLVTPALGAATATTINGLAITSSTGTLTVANSKTATVNNSLTFAGTDATTQTFQGTDTILGRATTDTLTNKTYDTAGTGNSILIAGLAVTANTGTGSVVRATAPTISGATLSGGPNISQNVMTTGVITPTALSGAVNDYNPSGLATASVIRQDGGAADRNITGLTAQGGGTELKLFNVGTTNALVLKNQNGSSAAANRFLIGADISIAPGQSANLWYDATANRWLVNATYTVAGGSPAGTVTSVTGGQGCVSGSSGQTAITASGTINCAPGFANKLRNSGLTSWFHGTSPTITTAGAPCAEGTYVVPTGASVVCSRLANTMPNPLSFYEMVITGATSVTDVVVRYVIESFDAAPLAGQQVTCQWLVFNGTGGSITPTLTVKRANTQDATYTNTDVSAASLQTIVNNGTSTLAYSWAANANSFNGLSIDIDFGNNFSSGAKSVILGGGFDCRVTPGVSTGTVASPPAPEIPTAAHESAWNMRFYEGSYDNGVAAGTVTAVGEQDRRNGAANSDLWNILYKVQKRADATLTLFSPNSGTSAKCYDNTGAVDIGAGVFNSSNGTNGASVSQTSGTSAVGDAIRCHWAADAILVGG